MVSDVQVVWEGLITPSLQHDNKRAKYRDDPKFVQALEAQFPGKTVVHEPLTLGARGIWPRCNKSTEDIFQVDKSFKNSCVAAVLKWGCSVRAAFGRKV